jgi:hypothetical protein
MFKKLKDIAVFVLVVAAFLGIMGFLIWWDKVRFIKCL